MSDYLGPYLLGPNDENQGIYTGDARELARAIPEESVALCIADPPYFRIADEDWDRQWRDVHEYADWCLEWGGEIARGLCTNGSCFVFGDEKNIAYVQTRLDALAWGLLNSIVWTKTNYTMLKASPEAMRSFRPQGEERILFYGRDISFPSFSEIRNPKAAQPMAQYLRAERKRAGVPMHEVASLFPSKTGQPTGCVSNWELGYNFPLPEQYAAMKKYLNDHARNGNEYLRREYEDLRREYEDLRREYEDLRREYEDLRRPFFGGKFTDVWEGPLISASHKKHPCHKPEWIIRRMILTTTRPGDIILEPFAGSGEICRQAKMLGRRWLAFEIDPDTAEKARERVAMTQPPLFVMEPEQVEMGL